MQAGGTLGKEHKWERQRRKQSLCFTQAGETPFQQLCSLWAVAAKAWEGVWHQRHFLFPFKAESHGEAIRRLLLPKGWCCSEPPWADFLMLPAGLAAVSCRDGMGTCS